MRGAEQIASPPGNCYRDLRQLLQAQFLDEARTTRSRDWRQFGLRPRTAVGMVCAVGSGTKGQRTTMGPAIALRLRQHLTLTPQVQQALKLLQMSAMEFAQEMEQALTSNPFLEENAEAPTPAPRDGASVDDVIVPQEPSSGGPLDREQDDWGSLKDAQPTLSQPLRD